MQERSQFQKTPYPQLQVNPGAFSPGAPRPNPSVPGDGLPGGKAERMPTPLPLPSLPSIFGPSVLPGTVSPNNLNDGSLPGVQNMQNGLHPRVSPTPFEDGLIEARRQRKRKRITGVLLGGICLVLLAFGYVLWNLTIGATPAVTLYQVGAQNFSQDIGGGGIIFPRQQLDISYPVAERVVGVMVKPGDQISVNQPLIQLDPSLLNAQIQQASDNMSAAQAYLVAVSTSGNPVTIAQAQQAYNMAKNKYNALVAQASSPLLRNGNLISPMSGVVTTVNVNPGEVFAADSPMLTIMDESVVIVHVKVPLANLGQVHLGQTAQVTPSSLPGQVFQGTVTAVIPQADSQTDTFEVWVAIANSDMSLLPGMSAYVRIQSSAKAVGVPRLAVLDAGGMAAVFIASGAQVYETAVHVVGRSTDTVIVDGGVRPGDKVVLVGLDQMRNGETVRVTAVER